MGEQDIKQLNKRIRRLEKMLQGPSGNYPPLIGHWVSDNPVPGFPARWYFVGLSNETAPRFELKY